ncbi:MAG TPA: hypothetical protein VFY03_00120 [Woeseiaceae bacterium]|nr:hypothetical protein [Woeseiaceae bacterium]
MMFWLSTLALLAGPFVYAWGRSRPVTKQMLDGFVLIAVAGIVCVNIIPSALDIGGLYALVALAGGLAFPVAIERVFHRSAHRAHVFIVVLAALGLVLHAIIDGIALLPAVNDQISAAADRTNTPNAGSMLGNPLALGVILHRLPVGVVIWWSVRPQFGLGAALATFALLIAATAAAYFEGAQFVELATTRSLALFQAFVAGSLVHVVAFGVDHGHDGDELFVPAGDWGFRVGILIGMFVIFVLPHIH